MAVLITSHMSGSHLQANIDFTTSQSADMRAQELILSANPSKVKLLRMKPGRCVFRRRRGGDGTLTCAELYLEYNRKIFQLILL